MASPRRRRGRIILLGAIAAGLILVPGAGYWAVTWGPLRPVPEPQTIIVIVPGSSEAPSASPSETPVETATAGGSSDASATPTSTPVPGATLAPPRPDLVVAGYSNPYPRCGQPFHMSVRVRNVGEGPAPATVARLADRYGATTTYSQNAGVPALAAGDGYDAEWHPTFDVGCGHEHILTVTLDVTGSAAESDESNNILELTYELEHGPELWAPTLTLSPADPSCGSAFTASVEVRNTGTLGAHDGLVRFVDTWEGTEQKAYSVSFPSIPAGASTTVSRTFTIGIHCGQTHRMTAYIDYGNLIDEIDEDNNTNYRDYVP